MSDLQQRLEELEAVAKETLKANAERAAIAQQYARPEGSGYMEMKVRPEALKALVRVAKVAATVGWADDFPTQRNPQAHRERLRESLNNLSAVLTEGGEGK